ncbi:MAG: hypothetical protein ACJA07_000421 [Rhodococcus sp. (in: high G+C Gram-positive bacteria)]|jgi:hypothetical protein
MVDIAIVFAAFCVMFVIVVRAVINPSFMDAVASMVTPTDALCGLAVVAYLATWSNNGDAMRAFVGVAVLAVALVSTAGGVTRTRRNSVDTSSKAASL